MKVKTSFRLGFILFHFGYFLVILLLNLMHRQRQKPHSDLASFCLIFAIYWLWHCLILLDFVLLYCLTCYGIVFLILILTVVGMLTETTRKLTGGGWSQANI
jgi:hypothetical protein